MDESLDNEYWMYTKTWSIIIIYLKKRSDKNN